MKKTVMILTAIFMVFAISSVAKAGSGNPNNPISEQIEVKATVNPYCIVSITAPGALTFEGTPGEVKTSFGKIVKDCNTNTVVKAEVTQPLKNGNYTINTITKVDGANWGDTSSMDNYYDGNVHNILLWLGGKLGNKVSSQPAGEYSGTITVTVSAMQ